LKEIINIPKEDMEDYHWVMFTHVLEFFQEQASLKKPNSITFLHKLIAGFVDGGLSFPWQPPINKIYET
jgi:hypothetical protein